MARAVDLVIFDCDGVLVDSERIAVPVTVEVLAKLGWTLTEADVIERFIGHSHDFMVAEIEAHLGRRLPDDWEDEFEHLYRDALDAELSPVEGIVDALDEITAATCVASSGSQEKMRYTLGLTGLYERFAGRIFSACEVANGKPAPDLFVHAAEQMGVAPEACAVVEDSRWGIQAARAAGMRAFGFAGGLTPAHRLEGRVRACSTRCESSPGCSTSSDPFERVPRGSWREPHGDQAGAQPGARPSRNRIQIRSFREANPLSTA